MISTAELIGLVAGLMVTVGLVPQVLRVWRMREAKEISLAFNVLTMCGTVLWMAYGLILGLFSVMIWNGINFGLYVLLLSVKLRYGMGHGEPMSSAEGASQPGR